MTFSEVRKYQYGDDVRTIDWNVTARYREPYVKVFEEERELTLMLLVDISGSSNFGTRTKLKNEILTEIAATLAFSALNNNDKVGLVLFSNKIELFIAPKKGKIHILRIIRELLNYESTSLKTNISKALEFLSQVQKKKAIIFILSDFIDSDYSKSVQLLSKKHDLTGVRIFDIFEKELQKSGLLFVNDAETGRKLWINSSSKKVRESYNLSFRKNADYFKNTFSKNGAGAIALSTNDEYVKTLLNYFKNRA